MLLAAENLGVSKDELTVFAPCRADRKENGDARVPLASLARLDKALRTNPTTSSATALGEQMSAQDISMLAYVLKNSRTLHEYFENLSTYWTVVMDSPSPELDVQGDRAIFGCIYSDDLVSMLPHTLQATLVEWVARARAISGVNWKPQEILVQTSPRDTTCYEGYLGTSAQCGAAGTWLVFDTKVLEYKIPRSDRCLLDLLMPIVEREKETLAKNQCFLERVEATVEDLLDDGIVSAERVASEMAISTRTLQRKLGQEGRTFSEVLDATRRSAALTHLRNSRIAISETAYRVGFSEPSTFYRAFKRWTGETPASYRRTFIG